MAIKTNIFQHLQENQDEIYLIAEIGINHNGDLNIAKKLIDSAVDAGFDAVKFQKRNVEKVYSKEFLDNLNKDAQDKLANKDITDHDRYVLNHKLDVIKEIKV